jgi:hypothetical protein
MASTSQASFVARLSRAEQLFQHINSFANYTPSTNELSVTSLQNLIAQINQLQTLHTTTHFTFAEAAKERELVFTKSPNAILKNITLIKAYIKSRKGASSQQFIDIDNLVTKMRGGKTIKITKNATEQIISNSERSYGSQLQNFANIKELLNQFGTDYEPANNNITLGSINNQFDVAKALNNQVTNSFAQYKPTIAQRQNLFKTLLEIASRIKENVKSQYGTNSPEYKLIKGLKF